MPAQSQQQQKLFGLALSVKRGETPRSEASEDVLNIVDSMTEKEIEDFAGTSHKGLPKKVEEMIRGMVRENLKQTLSEANPRLNKKVKSYLDSYLSGVKKNSPEHQHALMLIMRGALTDANFHSEARQLGKYFPKASQHKVSSQMEDVIESKGEEIASWAKWDGYDIIDAFAFYTSMTIGGSFGAKFQSLKEGITNEINEMNEAGISRMYMVFLGAQKKVKELEDAQKELLAQWKAEKDPKKKAKIFDKMKKGTVTLRKRRANLSDIERDYINNMAYDTSYSESMDEASTPSIKMVNKFEPKEGIQIMAVKTLDGKTHFGGMVQRGKLARIIPFVPNQSKSDVQKRALEIYNELEKDESVNESASRTAMEIGALTGLNKDAVQKFVDDNNLDIEKLYQYVKKGKLPERMELVSAIAGRPNNPVQKKVIKMFSESINERLTTSDMKYMDGLALKKSLDTGLKELRKVGQDLIDSEGFDKNDVKEFLLAKLSRVLHVGLNEGNEK